MKRLLGILGGGIFLTIPLSLTVIIPIFAILGLGQSPFYLLLASFVLGAIVSFLAFE